MKRQVLLINGGDAFDTYADYLNYLKTRTVSLERLRPGGWKSGFQKAVGEECDVFLGQMPNSQNAKYSEWKIWFERILELFDGGVVLIGHSLGGIFLAKYLSENVCPQKIKAVFLIAAPYSTREENHIANFDIENDLSLFEKQAGKIFLYHSRDDVVVPFSDFEKYKEKLPHASFRAFDGKGHFNQEEFPELVTDIKSL